MEIICESVEDGINKFVLLLGREILSKSQDNLKEFEAIDTGELLRSSSISVSSGVSVIYSAPYADYIEYGTKPHTPPLEPIKDWAKRKLGLTDKEAENVAKMVVYKISKHGTEAKPYLRNAVDYTIKKYSG